jgi:hypothetical protein
VKKAIGSSAFTIGRKEAKIHAARDPTAREPILSTSPAR